MQITSQSGVRSPVRTTGSKFFNDDPEEDLSPPSGAKLERVCTPTQAVLTMSLSYCLTGSVLGGYGTGTGDIRFLIPGAIAAGVGLTGTIATLIFGPERYSPVCIPDNRKAALAGAVTSILAWTFTALLSAD